MKNDIQMKLRQLLAGDCINDEAKVVYLLVQSRKLLKHDKALKTTLPTLEFYCNWGLHVQLSRQGAQAFLDKVNPILTLTGDFGQQQHDACNALLTLDAFRLELRSLLTGFGAATSICDDSTHWTNFLRVYSEVVKDSELTLKGKSAPSGPLGLAVQKVIIHPIAGAPTADLAVKVYPMIWLIEYADGRIGRLELSQFGLWGATVDMYVPAPAATCAA